MKIKLFQNIGFLALGSVLGQLVGLIGALYIPHLLGPHAYGIYNMVTVYVAFFVEFTLNGIEKVIIRECSANLNNTKEILESTVSLRNLFSLSATLLSILVVFFIDYDQGTKIYIAIFSFSLLLSGMQGTVNTIYQSYEKMGALSVFSVLKPLIRVPLAILVLKIGYGILSIIAIDLFTQLLILAGSFKNSKKIIVFNIYSKIKFPKNYITQGLSFSFINLLGGLSTKIDLIMLSVLDSPEKVGIYALAYRIAEKGLIIHAPIAQSLFPHYARQVGKKNVSSMILKHSLLVLIPPFIASTLVLLFSKQIIIGFVGQDFEQSAAILNVLILYLMIYYMALPSGVFLQVSHNEKFILVANFIRALSNIIGNLVLFKLFGLIGIAYSTLINTTIIAFTQLFYAFAKSRKRSFKIS